jgi:hypothetical protein
MIRLAIRKRMTLTPLATTLMETLKTTAVHLYSLRSAWHLHETSH